MAEGTASDPATASFALVTGCQMAHATCLAAARHGVLARVGWDVERDGLAGAPPIRVVAGAKRHVTIDRALRLLGLGTGAIVEVAADAQGRMDPAALRATLAGHDGPTIVCAQLGEVNSGAFDPIAEIAELARDSGGLAPRRRRVRAVGRRLPVSPLARRRGRACRLVDDRRPQVAERAVRLRDRVRRHPESHRAAMTAQAEYLVQDPGRGARRGRLDARVLAPCAGLRRLRRAALARPLRRRRPRRALLRARPSVRRGDRGPARAARS